MSDRAGARSTRRRDGDATRRRIVAQAAGLLNCQGYLRAPVSEIMRVTGLKKGGIYNHFESRDALALEAFNYAFERMRRRLVTALSGRRSAGDKLRALIGVMRNARKIDEYRGGCPIMNLAIESDDADPRLRTAARHAMGQLVGFVERIIREGIELGEFAKGDARARANSMVAAVEGALMLSNLYKDDSYLRDVAARLELEVSEGLR
jgi:AcrR family transcriptional regulator